MGIPSVAIKFAVLAVGVAAAFFALTQWRSTGQSGVVEVSEPALAKDEIVVLRTPGGKLQVATLVKNEEFSWKTSYTLSLIHI